MQFIFLPLEVVAVVDFIHISMCTSEFKIVAKKIVIRGPCSMFMFAYLSIDRESFFFCGDFSERGKLCVSPDESRPDELFSLAESFKQHASLFTARAGFVLVIEKRVIYSHLASGDQVPAIRTHTRTFDTFNDRS